MHVIRWVLCLLRPARQWDVFRYHDGQRTRYADPLRLLARLDEDRRWPKLNQAIADLAEGDLPNRLHVLGKLADEVRSVFNLEEVRADGRGRRVGLADLECADLLTRFLNWCAAAPDDYRLRFAGGTP